MRTKPVTKIPIHCNIGAIATDPEMADFAIREDRIKIKKLKAGNRKLKIALMMKDKEKTVEVTDDKRVLAVETILQGANSNVDQAFPDAEDKPT